VRQRRQLCGGQHDWYGRRHHDMLAHQRRQLAALQLLQALLKRLDARTRRGAGGLRVGVRPWPCRLKHPKKWQCVCGDTRFRRPASAGCPSCQCALKDIGIGALTEAGGRACMSVAASVCTCMRGDCTYERGFMSATSMDRWSLTDSSAVATSRGVSVTFIATVSLLCDARVGDHLSRHLLIPLPLPDPRKSATRASET
jgi:hypothetical protein